MPSVERPMRRRLAPKTKAGWYAAASMLLWVLLWATLGGCATQPGEPAAAPPAALTPAPAPGPAAAASAPAAPDPAAPAANVVPAPAAPVVPAPAASAGAASPGPAAPPAPPPIDTAVQQAFEAANRALTAGRRDEAERGYRALIETHPELGGPHAGLGLVHRQAGRLAESAASFERAVQASPRQPRFYNQLGVAYRQLGAFDKARAAYERAIELDPAYAAPVLNLGILHDLYLGDGARALALYEQYQAMTAKPDPAVVKWVADLKNRKPGQRVVSRKEQP